MKISHTKLNEVKLIQLKVFSDSRGFFVERYNETKFALEGLPTYFAQDNHSSSAPGVLRGLHYQYDLPQGKLVGVIRGKIWDVAVDIRPQSPTYGEYVAEELSAENGCLLWIPPGFAHGFCVLDDEPAEVYYKVTTPYNPAGEEGILWNDNELAIDWPIAKPVISERDQNLKTFAEYKAKPRTWNY